MNGEWGYRIAWLGCPLAFAPWLLHSHGMEPNFVPTCSSINSVNKSV